MTQPHCSTSNSKFSAVFREAAVGHRGRDQAAHPGAHDADHADGGGLVGAGQRQADQVAHLAGPVHLLRAVLRLQVPPPQAPLALPQDPRVRRLAQPDRHQGGVLRFLV